MQSESDGQLETTTSSPGRGSLAAARRAEPYAPGKFHYEMIRSELEEVVGEDHITTQDADRLIYSCDWFWPPQMWRDRGQPLPAPDYIVHPGSAEEISHIMEIANKYKIPVIPWGGGPVPRGARCPSTAASSWISSGWTASSRSTRRP